MDLLKVCFRVPNWVRGFVVVVLGVALVMIGLVGVGCSGPRREVVVGKMSAGGGLIFYEWDAGRQKRQAVLKKGYGMMVFYDVFQKDSSRRSKRTAGGRGSCFSTAMTNCMESVRVCREKPRRPRRLISSCCGNSICHSCESRNPGFSIWTPAFAGVTSSVLAFRNRY